MVNWLINSCDVDSHLRIYIPDMALTNLSTEWRFCPPNVDCWNSFESNLTFKICYLPLQSIQEVVANRTDVATQYNETFLNDNELEKLW